MLFSGTYYTGINRNYDIFPDGQRFLMLKEAEQKGESRQEIIVVLNWFQELKRLARRSDSTYLW